MHGGGLVAVRALQVVIGECEGAGFLAHAEPHAMLHAGHPCQCRGAFAHVFVFDQKSGLPVAAIGNERIVGFDFLVDGGGLEDALHAQHFLHLILHGEEVLEQQRRVGAQGDAARFLVGDHLVSKRLSFHGVLLQAPQTGAAELHRSRARQMP